MARKSSRAERIEWGLGIVSGLAVLAIVGYLAAEGLGHSLAPPDLSAAVVPTSGAADQLRFAVTNAGGRAASGVSLAATWRDGDRVVAERRLTIDQVPGRSRATGGFLLPPAAEGLAAELSVEGYLDP